jgi:hypothetical protein
MRARHVASGIAATLTAALFITACSSARSGQSSAGAGASDAELELAGQSDQSLPSSASLQLIVGDAMNLGEFIKGGRGAITYRSSDSTVVAVSRSGQLRALRPGSATLTTTSESPRPSTDTVKVVVMTPRQAVNQLVSVVCPNEDERYLSESLPIRSDLPVIHEYHDCQRLIIGNRYSALVGIFAHRNVDTYQSWSSFQDGHLAALIVDFVTKGQALPYPSLGIEPGTNCLVLKADANDVWQAAIVNQASPLAPAPGERRYGSCPDNMKWSDVPASAKNKLVVRVQKGVDMNNRPIAPPVARWDWDETHRLNYIGVKCDSVTWCEIGPRDFVPSVPQRTAANRPILKGYYDEQYLADSSGTRVTSVFGTIIPGRDERDTSGISPGIAKWFHLAQLRIHETGKQPSPDYDFYRRKFFATPAAATPPFGLSAIADLMIRPKVPVLSNGYDGRSNGHLLGNPLAHPPIPGVIFRSHWSSHVKVPTVRWTWHYRDEGTWGYCSPYGCCESSMQMV